MGGPNLGISLPPCAARRTSCTVDLGQAAHMARWELGTVLQMKIEKGYQLQALSRYPEEGEVLLPPHSQFVVVSGLDVVQVLDVSGQSHDVRVIRLQHVKADTKKLVS